MCLINTRKLTKKERKIKYVWKVVDTQICNAYSPPCYDYMKAFTAGLNVSLRGPGFHVCITKEAAVRILRAFGSCNAKLVITECEIPSPEDIIAVGTDKMTKQSRDTSMTLKRIIIPKYKKSR